MNTINNNLNNINLNNAKENEMENTTITITITMTPKMYEQMEIILSTREERTQREIDQQIFERGLYDMAYRTLRNKRVYEEQKSLREEIKQLKAQLRQR